MPTPKLEMDNLRTQGFMGYGRGEELRGVLQNPVITACWIVVWKNIQIDQRLTRDKKGVTAKKAVTP
jgi:hypothetical protein